MKNIKFLFNDFILFFRKDFNLGAYAYTIAVTTLSIVIIYCTPIGNALAYNRIPTSNVLVNSILMFVVIYFIIVIPTLIIRGELRTVSKKSLFLKGLLFMCLIGFSTAFSNWDMLPLDMFSTNEQSYILKALWRMCNLIFVFPVLVFMRLAFDKDVNGLYGLSKGKHHIKAYLSLYVVILPILIIVSFTPDFLSYYPIYKPWDFEGAFNRPLWLNSAIFEIIYLSDFLMVEMIFRGALVIGMASILGRKAVLPMIAVYVALHFGKPVMETISAFFGGYFLGALAFQTRHIWGGVIIHMGIAFIIELLRFFQHFALGM